MNTSSRIFFFVVLLFSLRLAAQDTVSVTGTAVPPALLRINFGRLPKGIGAYDLNICNNSSTKAFLTSSEILSALALGHPGVQPVGREIMLASVLRNQNRSLGTILPVSLNAITGVLSVLSSAKYGSATGLLTGIALGALSGQQLLAGFRPVLSADQLQNFENQVLPSALIVESNSCVERTVFALAALGRTSTAAPLHFHLR